MNNTAIHCPEIGVFYLAWGVLDDPLKPFETFIKSYLRYQAGIEHKLYIICKGFFSNEKLDQLKEAAQQIPHTLVYVDERELDIGAYYAAAANCDCEVVCFLNTYSEILGEHWLAKLMRNLARPGIGLVGCTGSYEAPCHAGRYDNIPPPNPHIRSNAFMLSRDLFLRIKPRGPFNDKMSTYMFEHQRMSLTRRVVSQGFEAVVVGKDGRGYLVNEWPRSRTFRQGGQLNLLIGDNRTRDFDFASPAEKRALFKLAWADRSYGLVELSNIEDFTEYELVAAAYQSLLHRPPAFTEYEAGVELIGASGEAKLIEHIVQSAEFSSSGRYVPGFAETAPTDKDGV